MKVLNLNLLKTMKTTTTKNFPNSFELMDETKYDMAFWNWVYSDADNTKEFVPQMKAE